MCGTKHLISFPTSKWLKTEGYNAVEKWIKSLMKSMHITHHFLFIIVPSTIISILKA